MKTLHKDITADPIPRETRFESYTFPDAPNCPVDIDWTPPVPEDSWKKYDRRIRWLVGIYIVAQVVWFIATIYE